MTSFARGARVGFVAILLTTLTACGGEEPETVTVEDVLVGASELLPGDAVVISGYVAGNAFCDSSSPEAQCIQIVDDSAPADTGSELVTVKAKLQSVSPGSRQVGLSELEVIDSD